MLLKTKDWKTHRGKNMENSSARSENHPFGGSSASMNDGRRTGVSVSSNAGTLATSGSSKVGTSGTPGSSVSDSVTRSKEAIGLAANEAMTSGASDLQSLRDDFNSLKDTLTTFMAKAGNEAARSAREVTSNVAGQVSSAASDLAGRGADIASAATEQAKTFASEIEGMARRNPIGALAGAILIGVLIGMMGRRN